MNQKIKFTVPKIGISKGDRLMTHEVDGVTGTTCKDLTKLFIGDNEVVEETDKPERYEDEQRHEFLDES